MLKILLTVGAFALVLIVVFVAAALRSGSGPPSVPGTIADITPYLGSLARSTSREAFLVIQIAGTDDFLQLKHHEGVFEIDFPVFTERQHALESRVRSTGNDLGLTAVVTEADGENRFIDFHHSGTPPEVASAVQRLLLDVFEVPGNASLEFTAVDVEPPAG